MKNITKSLLCITMIFILIVLPSCSMFWSSNPTYSGGQMLDDELMSSMRDEVLGEKTEISDQEVSDEITEDENESENSDEITTEENESENSHEKTTEENESENSHEKTESSESQDNTESSKINEESSTKHDQEESSTKHDQEESSTKHDHQESTPVYWTENGGVYHLFRDCSYIKSSAEVISGTVEEANDAGKSDACSRCQNRKDKE